MTVAALEVEDLCLRFGGLLATDHVTFSVPPGELRAIIGPNGAGKSTLIAQLAGDRRPDSGRIRLAGVDVTGVTGHARAAHGLGRSFQITSVFPDFTALHNVAVAVQAGEARPFGVWRRAWDDESLIGPARTLLVKVGLHGRADCLASELAHGERRALEMAIALARRPTLLLLDEPLAGMGPEEGARMVRFLAELRGSVTILLVEHDMDAVFSLADRISVLVYGRLIATGTPDQIRAHAEVRRAYLGEDD